MFSPPHERLLLAIRYATQAMPAESEGLQEVPLTAPALVRRALMECLGDNRLVVVTGTLDRRLVLIEGLPGEAWTAADLSGSPHKTRAWPLWTDGHLTVADPTSWLSHAKITAKGLRRLLKPRLLLTSLYHPEYFPLPRFPLAISDLARAARATLLGDVELMDMQLGVSLPQIIERVAVGNVDILGISATFGQHDLMVQLLDAVYAIEVPPLVVAGGSLTARNEKLLLDRYPRLIVARAAGEPTIQDVLAYWHGDLEIDEIRGAGYRAAARGENTVTIGRLQRTARVPNRVQTVGMWPELDLLAGTFEHGGVAQLEVSRGCTNHCSFCPRGHKGHWAGAGADALRSVLGEMGSVFDQNQQIPRRLYLVDEEFIGQGADAVSRALEVADALASAGFRWETSCRVDQVVRLDRGRDWHIERCEMWRGLVQRGLRRCLFGVESGVTSILERFNKETTGEQNALAIRTLSALNVPPRYTYIVFDPLMTLEELVASYAFLGRTDLLLRATPELSATEIVDGVRDEKWASTHATDLPFFTAISYMLVSMECLIGAPYTRKAEAAGLTGELNPLMGRVEAKFADWRIGVCSQWAQRWVDRNFALDYTLKSLEKVVDGHAWYAVREARVVFKQAAFRLLGHMIDRIGDLPIAPTDSLVAGLHTHLAADAGKLVTELHERMAGAAAVVRAVLPEDQMAVLDLELSRWLVGREWKLINVAGPCGR